VPASTIRALQRFLCHNLTLSGTARERMVWVFQVHERTVMRWEKRGAVPDSLPNDPDANPPDWRRKLLFWLIEHMEKTPVTDNRKKEGPCPDPAP
jgi:hypothetical protein